MDTPLPHRRTVLAGAAGGIALPLLAACGSTTPKAQPTAGASTPGAGAASTPAGSGSSGSSGGGGGRALAKTSAIPVGGGTVFGSEQVVVTQPTAGHFKAFSAVCTHAGCLVTSVSGGQIHCPCHGSAFSVSDGSVQGGPAPSALPAKSITVKNGEISLG